MQFKVPARREEEVRQEVKAEQVQEARSHGRFRTRTTESLSEFGMKRVSGGLKRQCDRTRRAGGAAQDALGPGPPRGPLRRARRPAGAQSGA